MPYRGLNNTWSGYAYWECPAECGEHVDLDNPAGWDSLPDMTKKDLFEQIDAHLLTCDRYHRMTGVFP